MQNILDDPPPNAGHVLQPLEDTAEGGETTMAEGTTEDTAASSGSLKNDICGIMDMSATDNDGQETIDESKEVNILKEKDRLTRRQRAQGEEEEDGDAANERSRSRPQAPNSAAPRNKRTIKGMRSDPDDDRHATQLLKSEEDKRIAENIFKKGDDLVGTLGQRGIKIKISR